MMDGHGAVETASEEDIPNARVVVVGKAHYFETVKHFPFNKTREIKSAVLLDQNAYSPFSTTRCFIRKIHQTDDGATVNLWFISPEAAGVLEKQFISLVIPETALFSFHSGHSSRIYEVDLNGQFLLSWVGNNGAVQSLRSDNDGTDLDAFRRSIGRDAAACPVAKITGQKDYAVFLSETISGLPFNGLYPFANFNPNSVSLDSRMLKRGIYGAAASFAIYLTLSMAMPYCVEKRLEKEDTAISAQSVEWVEKQNEIDLAVKKQNKLADPINAYPSKYMLMTLLLKVMTPEARIIQMTVSNNRAEIRGEAPSATDLLTTLSETGGIRNAQFISPVRKESKTGRDMFTLSFEFNEKK